MIVILESIDLILTHYVGILCQPIILRIMLAYLMEAYISPSLLSGNDHAIITTHVTLNSLWSGVVTGLAEHRREIIRINVIEGGGGLWEYKNLQVVAVTLA